jgi:hypothetical protein
MNKKTTPVDFEEWFLEHGIPVDIDFNVAKRAYEAGQQSKQAEIDALRLKIQSALNAACRLQYSSGERAYKEIKELLK